MNNGFLDESRTSYGSLNLSLGTPKTECFYLVEWGDGHKRCDKAKILDVNFDSGKGFVQFIIHYSRLKRCDITFP